MPEKYNQMPERKVDLINEHESEFGLSLEHADERRKIYKIIDADKFLDSASKLGFEFLTEKIKNIFTLHPNGLKQFSVILTTDNQITLGKHFHKDIGEGGMGDEYYIFTEVPSNTDIKIEQYSLGKAKGKISYNIKSGTVIKNQPNDYHVMTCNGPFSMVQITSADEFKEDDLNKFNPNDWSPEDRQLITGYSNFEK